MTLATATIRSMTAVDVAPASDLLRRGDFGDREAFFAWALTQPTIAPFVAVVDGRIVGTGTGSTQGGAGWVGVIFVAAEQRGAGLGRRITRTVIDELEGRGCRSLLLIASPLGRPIYETEGFRVLERQVRFSIDGLPPDDGTPDHGSDRSRRPTSTRSWSSTGLPPGRIAGPCWRTSSRRTRRCWRWIRLARSAAISPGRRGAAER